GDNSWEYGNDPLESRKENARGDLLKYDKGSYLHNQALETINSIDNDPIGFLKNEREYWADKKPNESWRQEEIDAIVRDIDKKINQLQPTEQP
ncbi:hypothetical protein U2071_15610, partial [Listeria monocytogenes]|uniref:hypothetical protein n=1 Tax=Listeria monocytogenes TaxID=1639 RepID=UPI002FDC44EB